MAGNALAVRICCLDLDTFFVSVERLLNPELCGKPVVVGGTPGKRGVVTAASYEVRQYGVRSGMPMSEAVRRAPHAIYVKTRHGVYAPYSAKVKVILERYCPVVRPASIDEFYLDFAGCERLYYKPGDATPEATIERTVREMRVCIQKELGLPASAGLGTTRAIAKIASGLAKPAGVLLVPAGKELEFLSPLPVRKYPGIGPVAEKALNTAGVRTLGELLALPPGRLRARFGGFVEAIRRGARAQGAIQEGRDRPAFQEHDPSGVAVGSISNERTFRDDVGDPSVVEEQLRALSERVCWRARKRDIRARTVTLKLRYSDFQTLSRAKTVASTNAEADVYACVLELFTAARTRNLPIRLVGVALSNLEGPDPQLALPFGVEPRPAVGSAIDEVRKRFGYDSIRLGGSERWEGLLK